MKKLIILLIISLFCTDMAMGHHDNDDDCYYWYDDHGNYHWECYEDHEDDCFINTLY